ncbi:MAG: hypothetical protein DCF27_10645 [Lysobacteraceae bacterium]|nr:MAG: hypothetical protein DCF27_10645 [Xanthomonadaceae bacterium]
MTEYAVRLRCLSNTPTDSAHWSYPMGELLDRGLQRKLLESAFNTYPAAFPVEDLGIGDRELRVNVAYLDEHGLLEAFHPQPHGRRGPPKGVTITAKGIDFLAEDGGLGAILGVVTVRLHEDTLKELVAVKIRDSDLPPAEKERYVQTLRKLPAEMTKHLALKLMDAGLSNWQKALPLLTGILD